MSLSESQPLTGCANCSRLGYCARIPILGFAPFYHGAICSFCGIIRAFHPDPCPRTAKIRITAHCEY